MTEHGFHRATTMKNPPNGSKFIKGRDRRLGSDHRPRGARPGDLALEALLRRFHGFGGEPNSHVSLVDAAMPGMLPVINRECMTQAVRTGLGLKARINLRSVFDRKNYFYPDLPQGYQISQYKCPSWGRGSDRRSAGRRQTSPVGIERLHLEQDAGKSLHDQIPTMSFVDLNRSGSL